MSRPETRACRLLCALLLVLGTLAVAVFSSNAPAQAAVPTGAPALSGGVDGQVYATLVVGDTLFVGGRFTNAQVQGGSTTPRAHLAAFDLDTGALLKSWRADTNGIVRSLASSGGYLYVGGDFSTVGGVAQGRLARVSLTSGTVDTGFRPQLGGSVRAVAVGHGTVYAGGGFTMSGGTAQQDLAAFDADSGAKLSAYTASTDGTVDVLALSPDGTRLAVGGNFTTLSGVARAGLGFVDPGTGHVVGPVLASSFAPTLTASWSDDGTALFAGAGGSHNVAARWNASTGARGWHVTVGGDVQAVAYDDSTVYVGFHDNYQGDTHTKLLAVAAGSGSISTAFRPTFNQFWGVRSISAGPWGLALGGQFTTVSGTWAHNVVTWPAAVKPTIAVDTPGRAAYGSRPQVDVTVAGATGTVTLSGAGPTTHQTLTDGSASFRLPATLAVQTYTLTVAYAGDRLHLAGTATATLRVTKAPTSVTTRLLRQPSSHHRGRFEVRVIAQGGGLAPRGNVRVRASRAHRHIVVTRALHGRKLTVTIPRLRPGSWRMVATYRGDPRHQASSHRQRVTVS